MSAYFPPNENLTIFDAGLFSIANKPISAPPLGDLVNNLTFLTITNAPVFQPPIGTGGGTFPEQLTLTSAGTWEVSGSYTISIPNGTFNYIEGVATSINIAGSVPQNTFANWTNFGTTTANSPSDPIQFKFSTTNLLTITSPKNLQSSWSGVVLPNGATFSGSMSAIKISNSTA